MRTKWLGIAAVIAGTVVVTSMVGAQQPRARLSSGDATFVKNAGEGSKVEVELGQLAQQKASNDQVKQFGQRMAADLKDHKKDVTEFRKASQNAKDSDVKAWAAKTLPTIEEHLEMAQDLDKQLSTSR